MTIQRVGDLSLPVKRSIDPPGMSSQPLVVHDLGHCIHLELTDFPIEVVSVTTGNGVGGSRIFTFPAGRILRLGCTAQLSVRAETEDDFTDGTPEGDLGIGTVPPANADALGIDATDDDWATAAAFTMSDYEDADVALAPEAVGFQDGRTNPIDLYLNALVDAADIDDGVTTRLLVSGDIWISALNVGGV